MIKALRRKFILTTMALLFAVLAVMLTVLNLTVQKSRRNAALSEMYSLSAATRVPRFKLRDDPAPAESSASPPSPPSSPLPRHRSWTDDMAFKEMFAVITDETGNITEQSIMFDFGLAEEELAELTRTAFSGKHESGRIGSYLYLKTAKSTGTMIILRNYADDIAANRHMLLLSVLIGFGALSVLFAITVSLSHTITEPAERAFLQQKQFIADASHELKTPLSTIAINAEVLKGDIGQNRWLENIISECGQMEELVLSLLTLAKLDAGEKKHTPMEQIDLSALGNEEVLSYESIAYEKGIEFTSGIDEGIGVRGNRTELKQLISILLDNAFKYTDVPGRVNVTLKKNDQNAVLRVENTGADIDPETLSHLFERFYRADSSRTGGAGADTKSFGLGLAIAAEIVKQHNGKISVTSCNGKTEFTVVL